MENKRRVRFMLLLIVVLSMMLMQFNGTVVAAEEEGPLVTIMFFETDLKEALNEIALQTGINIIPDQTVRGLVTADLQEVPLEQALRVVTIGGGYTFKKIDDFYFVGLPDPKSETFGELSDLEVVELQHITVQNVINLLPTSLQNYVKGDPYDNILTINAPVNATGKIKDLINKLDQPVRQIEVKVVVTEVDSAVIKELGKNMLDFSRHEGQSISEDEIASGDLFRFGFIDDLMILETDFYGRLLTQLKILEGEQKAKVQADPRVLVADGEKAQLFIGDRQVLLVSNDDEKSSSRVERIEVGVGLELVAQIIGEDQIILKINPEISHFVETGQSDLIIKQNSLSTTLHLKDQQTVVLAGMTMSKESSEVKKVPILGDIPLIRWFFMEKVEQVGERELLVFVTPVIR